MATKVPTSCYGIPWKDSGLSSIDTSGIIHCYIWNNCVLITFTNPFGAQLRREYIAPDGRYFVKEHRLLAYLGMKVDKVQEENARADEYIQEVTA